MLFNYKSKDELTCCLIYRMIIGTKQNIPKKFI